MGNGNCRQFIILFLCCSGLLTLSSCCSVVCFTQVINPSQTTPMLVTPMGCSSIRNRLHWHGSLINCSSCQQPAASQSFRVLQGIYTCSSMECSTSCDIDICADMDTRGTASYTMVFSMDYRGTSAPEEHLLHLFLH